MLDELLTRQLAFQSNMDPRGIKWGIGKVTGTALYHVDILEGNKQSGRPDELKGKFTNPTLAQKAIEKYLKEAWDENDKQVQKLARKQHKESVTNSEG